MSGHSHFAGIKHKKEASDAQRGRVFSKLAREIAIAAKNGANPETNSKLKAVVEKAKSMNMPKDNIERALKKGSGEGDGASLEEVLFEAYAPGGVAVLIEGITDNNKRTLGEVKQILNQNGGKFVESGAVKWLFERKGIISISSQIPKEELEMKVIEAGADDIYWNDEVLDVYTKPETLEETKKNLETQGITFESSVLGWVPKETVSPSEKERESCEKLFEAFDNSDDITEVYSNIS